MDPQLRAHYNKYGKDKDLAPEGGFADPREHFQQMFGGDAFRSKCERALGGVRKRRLGSCLCAT